MACISMPPWGFAEIKPTSQAENKQALSKDLVRLGMLSKNAIDRWSIRGCLAIQVIGYEVTFFIMTQPSPELYIMFELCTVQLPSCLADLLAFITQVDDIASCIKCYED